MRRLSLAIVSVFCATAAGALARQATFRATTDVVSVDVAVTKGRNPVPGLTANEFVLRDNGVQQEVDAVQLETRPIDVTLVFGGALDTQLAQLGQGMTGVERLRMLLQPTDRVRLVLAGNEVRELSPMRLVSDPAPATALPRTRGVSLNDALFYALAWPTEPERRHLVVVFTNGLDPWDSTIEPDLVPKIAKRADAVLHAVLYEAPSESAVAGNRVTGAGWGIYGSSSVGERVILPRWRQTYGALNASIEQTGGTLRLVRSGLDGFQQILDDCRSSYLLRYTPRGVTRGGWHAIDVKVTRPGLTVRARKGYE